MESLWSAEPAFAGPCSPPPLLCSRCLASATGSPAPSAALRPGIATVSSVILFAHTTTDHEWPSRRRDPLTDEPVFLADLAAMTAALLTAPPPQAP